jgi:hypothetical protein
MHRARITSSSEPYEAHAMSLLARALALVGESDLSLEAASSAVGLAEVYDRYGLRPAGWAAQALAAAGQTDRAVELAKRVWVDGMWRVFRYGFGFDPQYKEDTLGAMVATLAKSSDRARELIKAALDAVNAIHPKSLIGRISGLTMVADGLFSLGSNEEAIGIYQRIDETLSSLPPELEHDMSGGREELLAALNCLADALHRAGYKQELCRILGEKRRRCREFEKPYDYLKANAEFVASLDDGTTLWAVCRKLMDVETWWGA